MDWIESRNDFESDKSLGEQRRQLVKGLIEAGAERPVGLFLYALFFPTNFRYILHAFNLNASCSFDLVWSLI